jgi:ASC-1-like (ASCH) protein
MCVITYYLHQHVLVTLMTTFRASLDKNTINILTPSVQDVYETLQVYNQIYYEENL